jgi:diguanylate cyclase (GGDEF)-like protein/PAS domain S-box-containing protein
MHSLDIRTLSLVAMLSSVLLAAGLQIVNRVIARDPSLRLWAWGASANGASFVLLALRGAVPDLLSIVLANTLLVAGSAWLYLGNRRFRGLPAGIPWYWFLTVTAAAVLCYFTYMTPSLSARIVVLSTATATVLFPAAIVLLRPGDRHDRSVRWFVAAGFLATSLFLGARAITTPISASPGQDFMTTPNLVSALSLVFGIALNVVLGIGLPLLVSGRMQQRLSESEAHALTLYRKTPAIMHSIDASGKLVNVSDLWLETFGYAFDEVLGRKSSDFLSEESRRFAVEKVLPEFFRTGSCVDIPYQFVTKDGRVLDMLLSAFAERDADDRIVRSLAVMTDVTARKRTEAALAESELRFRGAFETAAHGMALVSPDGRFAKANPALCAMLGYTEAELRATDFQSLTHPDDLADDLKYLHELLDGRIQTYQMEKRLFHKAGRIVWILLSVSLVRTEDGTPVHFVSHVQDITGRKLNQQALENLLAEQKAILENDLVGIVRVRNRTIIWANPAFEKMLGYAPRELAGTSTRQNFPSEEAYGAFGAAAYPELAAGKIFRSQIEHVRKDRSRIWVDISGSMLDKDAGESLWSFVDITERKQLEQAVVQNEKRMDLALAGADLGMWDLDIPSGDFTYNPRLVTMLGYVPGEAEVSVKTLVSILHPDDAAKLTNAFHGQLKGETQQFEAEYRLRRKDDHWAWILSRGKVVERDPSGRAIRMTGTSLDISGRKRTEAMLEAREARLATLIASMQDQVIVFDTSGSVVEYFEPAHSSGDQGGSSDNPVGKSYGEIFPSDVVGLFDEAIAGIIEDGRPRTFEYTLTVDKHEGMYQATVSPLIGKSKYPSGFLTVVRDITIERNAQRELDRVARSNTLLLESVGEGIYGVDAQFRATFLNPSARAMLGFTEEDVAGKDQHGLFHHHRQDGSPYPAEECPIRLTLEDGQIRREEDEWFWRKDGSGFPVAMTVTPLVETGARIGAVVIFQDISERKANEAKIRDLAFFDPLTRLPNRRLLLDRLGLALHASARRNTYGAILFLDLDNFKTLNDTRGHEIGDLLLVEVARRLLSCVRVEDTVARLGGDEFVVMLEDLDQDARQATAQAGAVGEKIRQTLGAAYSLQDCRHRCSSSIGVTLFKGMDANCGELLKRADMAMYQAKTAGRNTLRFSAEDALG